MSESTVRQCNRCERWGFVQAMFRKDRTICRKCENAAKRKKPGEILPKYHLTHCTCRLCRDTTKKGDDLLVLAETTLFPSVRYEDMSKVQRDACIEWAIAESQRRGIWPNKRPKERAA